MPAPYLSTWYPPRSLRDDSRSKILQPSSCLKLAILQAPSNTFVSFIYNPNLNIMVSVLLIIFSSPLSLLWFITCFISFPFCFACLEKWSGEPTPWSLRPRDPWPRDPVCIIDLNATQRWGRQFYFPISYRDHLIGWHLSTCSSIPAQYACCIRYCRTW